MINNKKVVVVLPAYNAALTLEKTYKEIPFDIVDNQFGREEIKNILGRIEYGVYS